MTMIVTDATVRIRLFFVAVSSMLSRAVRTSVRFSHTCHDVGQAKIERG